MRTERTELCVAVTRNEDALVCLSKYIKSRFRK